jgi:hypothetical protein
LQEVYSSLNLLEESKSYESESLTLPTESISLDDDDDFENFQPLEEW